MRVVGGSLRGRALAGPKSAAIRPTADRLRESLFNILLHAYGDPVAGARVLDLFAGTGALGIEATVSRRRVRAVRRSRRGGTRAVARERHRAWPRRRLAYFPARRHQAWARASAGTVFARLPRSALRPGLAQAALVRRSPAAGFSPGALVVVEEAVKAAEFVAPRRISRTRAARLRRHRICFLREATPS